MNANIKDNLKKKRTKITYKKWSDDEVKTLLEYLLEYQEVEKPTAQIYYRKLIDRSGIDASWVLLRWKVKNLKKSYLKAQAWKKSAAASILENEEGISSVQEKLRRMCRFYDELHNIFKLRKYSEFRFETFDSEMGFASTQVPENSFNEKIAFCGFEGSDDCSSTPVIQYNGQQAASIVDCLKIESDSFEAPTSSSAPLPSSYASPPSKETQDHTNSMQEFGATLERAAPKNSLNQLFALESERNKFLKLKLDFEREKFKKKFDLKERQFEEKSKMREAKLELKKLEMEKEERLRILELEKQERIQRLEIEMRYKYDDQNRS